MFLSVRGATRIELPVMSTNTKIIYHLGAPKPDMDILTASLRKDNELLRAHSALARRTSLYRNSVQERLLELEIEEAEPDQTTQFLEKLSAGMSLERLLVSDGSFLAPFEKTFSAGMFYANASEQVERLRSMFPDNACEFFLEIRNPATFIPDLMQLCGETAVDKIMNGVSPFDVLWSDVVRAIQAAAPDCKVTIWRHEDRAFIWPEILRAVSGVSPETAMLGDMDHAEKTLSAPAYERMVRFLEERTELNFKQVRRVVRSFLEADENPRAIDADKLPEGWSVDLAQVITENYATDVKQCRSISGVTFVER
jgi:hypothetical protein